MKVKILGVSGSPRHGNTDILVKEALEGAKEIPNVETEFISLAGKRIDPCTSCYKCIERDPDSPCQNVNDDFGKVWPSVLAADGIIFGSPVYYGGMTAQLAALRDRLVCLEINGEMGQYNLRNKVVGAIASGQGVFGGQEKVFQQIYDWVMTQDMIPVGPAKATEKLGIVETGSILGGGHSQTTSAEEAALRKGVKGRMVPRLMTELKAYGSKEEMTIAKIDRLALRGARNVGVRVAEVAKMVKFGFNSLPKEELAWPPGVKIRRPIYEDYRP